MRTLLMLGLLLAFACAATAVDLGNEKPAKPTINGVESLPDPDVLRQGGDTILDAVPIEIGDALGGMTTGYTNDYDEVCPYSGSTAPDVVYTFTPVASIAITVDMHGSGYDTKIYLYDHDLALVACNDDFYSDWTSRLENVPVTAGAQYFLIIDGYGTAHGIYTGFTEEFVPCVVEYPPFVGIEGEPPLVDGYVDTYNGGCNTSPEYPFQIIDIIGIGAKSGYYLNSSGGAARDTDWFQFTMIVPGPLYVYGDAEEAMYVFELGPHDCDSVEVIQSMSVGPCAEGTMPINAPFGSVVWIWCGPQHYWEGETYEFNYCFIPLYPDPVESHSWTDVKSLFD